MKRLRILLTLFAYLGCAFQLHAAEKTTHTREDPQIPKTYKSLHFPLDAHQSPYTACSWLLSTRTLLNTLEERNQTTRDSLTPLQRWALAILNNLSNSFLMAVNHEVYGHGFILRSLKKPIQKYRFFNSPQHILSTLLILPIGGLGAYTKVKEDLLFSHDEALLFNIGGSQANSILANEILLRNFENAGFNHHHANLFLRSFLDLPFYVLNTWEKSQARNDIHQYLSALDEKYRHKHNYSFKPEAISLNHLKKTSLLYLLNPIVYKAFSSFYDYITKGEKEVYIPHFRIGKAKYMPLIRIGLAPFGILYYLENYLHVAKRTYVFGLRGGKSPFYKTLYGGFSFKSKGLLQHHPYTLDPFFNIWYQPNLYLSLSAYKKALRNNKIDYRTGFGYLGGLKGGIQLNKHTGIDLTVGYKTMGFVEGAMPQKGLLLSGGISFHY